MTKNILDIDNFIEKLSVEDDIDFLYESIEKIDYIEKSFANNI